MKERKFNWVQRIIRFLARVFKKVWPILLDEIAKELVKLDYTHKTPDKQFYLILRSNLLKKNLYVTNMKELERLTLMAQNRLRNDRAYYAEIKNNIISSGLA